MAKSITVLSLVVFLCTITTGAQNRIKAWQYWFDEASVSTATQVDVIPTTELIVTSGVDTDALLAGIHQLHIRFIDENNVYSSVFSRFFYKMPAVAGEVNLSKVEYWFDNDQGNSLTQSISGTQSTWGPNMDVSVLAFGIHSLHIRFQDDQGHWSAPLTRFFMKTCENSMPDNEVVSYQYWLDDQKDKAISVEITPGQSMNLMEQLDFTTLVAGTHQISFRFLDKAGQWSSVITDAFIKKSLSVEDGLIAHYPLDGNAYDLSVYSHHGTVSEALPATDRFGHADGAYYFDGLNDCIVVPDADHLDIQDGEPFSVSLWLKHDGPNVGEYFLSKYNGSPGSTGAYAFGTGSAGDAYSWFYFAGEGGLENRGAIDLNSDIWHHYVAVYKPGEDVMLYVDGQVDIRNATTFAGNTNNTLDLHLGCGANKRQFYKGYMDDVRIYKRALTTDEIDGLFKLVPTTTKVEILEGIHVFPNPVQSSLKVHLGEHQGAALYLYNMSGKCMYSAVNDDQEPVIPTGTLAKGVYLLQVKSAKGQITFKIVKE